MCPRPYPESRRLVASGVVLNGTSPFRRSGSRQLRRQRCFRPGYGNWIGLAATVGSVSAIVGEHLLSPVSRQDCVRQLVASALQNKIRHRDTAFPPEETEALMVTSEPASTVLAGETVRTVVVGAGAAASIRTGSGNDRANTTNVLKAEKRYESLLMFGLRRMEINSETDFPIQRQRARGPKRLSAHSQCPPSMF